MTLGNVWDFIAILAGLGLGLSVMFELRRVADGMEASTRRFVVRVAFWLAVLLSLFATKPTYAIYNAGTIPEDGTVVCYVSASDAEGAGAVLTTDGTVRVYKGANTTEYTGDAITLTDDFDTYDGLVVIEIDTDYDGTADTFFVEGSPLQCYGVAITGAEVDDVEAINTFVCHFCMGNPYADIRTIEGADATDTIEASTEDGIDDKFTFTSGDVHATLDSEEVDVGTIEGVDASNEIDQAPTNAIVAYKLDHLVAVADADDPVDGSIIAELASSTGDWSTFTASTDSLEAISGYASTCDAANVGYDEGCGEDDPADVEAAIVLLCSWMDPLVPPSAPVLDDISWSSGEGVSGKNTWNEANPLTGYITADAAGSVNNSGDACDVTMGTLGNEHGVMDADTIGDKTGVLNDDVVATDNYPADCFGPGGADGGSTNDLKLLVNGSILHTVDLLTFGSGDSLNGNGSGFKNLLDDTPVYFEDLTPFPSKTYRTGEWYLDTADLPVAGYVVVSVQHVTDAGTEVTNVKEFLLDDNNTATAYSNEAFSGYPGAATTKDLSGVTYHSGTVTATYAIDIDNAYRNTVSVSTSAVSHPTDSYCSISDESLGNSGCNEAIQKEVSATATVDVTRVIGDDLVVTTRTDRTVQSDDTSTGATQSECLVDRDTQVNTDLAHYYADEGKRINSGEDFNTNISLPAWDGSESLVDTGSSGYDDGLQVTEDRIYYPGEATVADYSSLTSGPAGNPDYSTGITGTRYYFGRFYNATGQSNFALTILGSATLVNEGTLDADSNEVSIAIRLPTQTGWMDVHQEYVPNQWGSTSESATYEADVGCYAATYGADTTIPTNSPALGFTVGTKTTDDSYDVVFYRITAPQGWTGYIESIVITWGAS